MLYLRRGSSDTSLTIPSVLKKQKATENKDQIYVDEGSIFGWIDVKAAHRMKNTLRTVVLSCRFPNLDPSLADD